MRKDFLRAVLILLIFVALAGTHLFIYTQNISLKYRTTDLKAKLEKIKSNNRSMLSRVAKKENLGYIEKFAREKLGMVYPEEINYIVPSRDARAKD